LNTTTPQAATASVETTTRRPRHSGSTVQRLLETYGLIGLALVLCVLFSILPSTSASFPTTANLRVGLISQAVLIICTMGALFPIICGHYDFSVGAVVGLSSIMVGSVASHGAPLVVAILAGLGTGLAVGVVNGLLVTGIGIDSVVVTLGTTTLIAGVVSWKTSGQSIVTGIPNALIDLSTPLGGAIPGAFVVALAVVIVSYWVLRQTPFGRYLHATGDNPTAARLVGLRPGRLAFLAFLASAVLSSAAGVVQVGVAGAANPNVGPSLTLPAIAAVFLGVAAISPGRFNVWGTFVAIIFLAILNSGLNLASTNPYVSDLANGSALIIGVSLATILGKRRKR
jgi:ribose transport system permease protein